MEHNYGIILLAAGSSSRFGTPKQLIELKGSTLIKSSADIALEVTNNVVVVTGAHGEKVEEVLQGLPLLIARNTSFEAGIASSICLGLSTLMHNFDAVDGAIFMVCDQPYLTASVLEQLIQIAQEKENGIVASSYGGTVGIPVLFKQKYFSQISNLTGDIGAKKIIQTHMADVAIVVFAGGEVDIDTSEDLKGVLGEY
jgi:molybdenum cofactor cytidylyltransferase